MINYKYSFTDALNNPSSTSTTTTTTTINSITGHHKRSNSIHLQHSPQQKQDCIFEGKLSQESSRSTLSDSFTSTITTTPQQQQQQQQHQQQQTTCFNRFQPRLSEPIIDLNKITEEYNNCQRRLSIASIKRANDSMINWCQFLQEDEDTRFYSQELNQDGLNSSSSLTNLPISSEILLDTFNEDNHNDGEEEEEEEEKNKRNLINSSDDEGFKKHNNIQLIRTLSRLTRKNSFSMIKSSRKSTTSA